MHVLKYVVWLFKYEGNKMLLVPFTELTNATTVSVCEKLNRIDIPIFFCRKIKRNKHIHKYSSY